MGAVAACSRQQGYSFPSFTSLSPLLLFPFSVPSLPSPGLSLALAVVTGDDRVRFLHNQTTADFNSLQPGQVSESRGAKVRTSKRPLSRQLLDRVRFLHNQTTADFNSLQPGQVSESQGAKIKASERPLSKQLVDRVRFLHNQIIAVSTRCYQGT